jgi:uncharacterized protein with FMN-binding domain
MKIEFNYGIIICGGFMKSSFLAIIVLLIFVTCCSVPINVSMPNISGKPDGVYRGESSNAWLTVVLDVSLQSEQLVKIDVVKHTGSSIGKQAEKIIPEIIKTQSLDVDAVSGATGSSRCILQAIENALQ